MEHRRNYKIHVMNVRIRKIIPLCLAVIAASGVNSCGEAENVPQGEAGRQVFCISTKSDETPGGTFRLMFHDQNTKVLVGNGTGTYDIDGKSGATTVDGYSGATLRPRVLKDDGSVDATATKNQHDNAYAQPNAGTYKVVCVSPGIKCESDGGFLLRSSSDAIKMTESRDITIYGFGHYPILNPLKDPRSRIVVKFMKDSKLKDIDLNVNTVRLYGAGNGTDEVVFYPAIKQVVADRTQYMEVPMVAVLPTDLSPNEDIPIYETKEPVYVISSIYAPKDIVQINVGNNSICKDTDYLLMTFNLKYGDKDSAPVNLAVSQKYPELKPQYEYTYEIAIRSEYISLSIIIHSCGKHEWGWHPEDMDNQTVGGDTEEIRVEAGTWRLNGGNWELEEMDNQIIE